MSYERGGEVTTVYRPQDGVELVHIGSATSARFIARGSLTRGRFGLFRCDMTAGAGGANAHYHRTFSEWFFILFGTVRLYDGERWLRARAGDFLSTCPRAVCTASATTTKPRPC